MNNIWEKAVSSLKSEVNDQVFTAWFLPIQQASADAESITLEVPNKFFENWIRDRYISLIKTAIQQVAGKSLSITFKIAELSADALSNDHIMSSGPGSVNPIASAPGDSADRKRTDKEHSGGWLKSVFSGSRQMPESRHQDLGLNPNYTFDNFVVGGNNRFAHAAAMAICEKLSKVYNPFFLYGGVGLGKTHLMQAMGHEILKNQPRARVLYMTSEEFTNQLIHAIRTRATSKFRSMYRNVDILLVDDIQFIAGKNSTQEEFFHTFNALHDAHKQIVVCSDRSPQEITSLEERLVSRFAWGLIADIQMPDFETRIAIMGKKSEHESVNVSKEVLYFLAENVKTNIREMEGALIRVVAYAKLTGTEMTVSLAKEVLKGMITAEDKKITVPLIQKTVAGFFEVTETDMLAKKRTRSIVYPRQIAMYLTRSLTDHSFPDIGGFFGGRDHTTVLHACEKINKELKENGKTRSTVKKLISLIKK